MSPRSSTARAALALFAGLTLAACSSSSNPPPPPPDSGTPDSGTPDSGTPDSGTPDSGTPDSGTPDAGPSFHLTILHTNDLHSHLEPQAPSADYSPLVINNDATVGGFARLAANIQAVRAAANPDGGEPILLLDSGDFMMDTLFQALGTSQAAELMEMQNLGYDAITLGNHEFDWTPAGLAGILNAAVNHNFTVPIVASNLVFSASDSSDDQLQAFQTAGVIVSKKVLTLSNGLKVGIFGMMGKEAATETLAAPITFANQQATAQAAVDDLRNNDHVDLVIMLSHGGSHANNTGDDVDLVNGIPGKGIPAVNGIDVIVSGHTHDALTAPLVDNHTVIVQAGAFGKYLGELKLTVTPAASQVANVDTYQLITNDDSTAGDSATQTRVDGYKSNINTLFQPAGLTYDTVVATTSFDLPQIEVHESGLGDLVADAYRAVASANVSPPDGGTVDVALEADGTVRAGIEKGTDGGISFADAYRVVPLGVGPDQVTGYPLVTFYVNGADVKSGLEVAALAHDVTSDTFFFQIAGMSYTYDPNGPTFFRVSSATIGGNPVNFSDTSHCYLVVTSEYTAALLGKVAGATGGILSVTPKKADCSTVITDFTPYIVKFANGPAAGTELHAWQALVGYMQSFTKNADNVPVVPSVYQSAQGRITFPDGGTYYTPRGPRARRPASPLAARRPGRRGTPRSR
jgi:5'-nucleotidase/UDP-sugar diphosphatase